MLKLHKDTKTYIIDKALTHIKGVEKNPDQTFDEDGDNFDYWNSVQLSDGNFVDYNIHESNFGVEYDDFDGYEWHCSAFAVDPPTKDYPHPQINTDKELYLFTYKDGKVIFKD